MSQEPPPGDKQETCEARRDPYSDPISLELPSDKYVDSFFEAMAEFASDGNPQCPEDVTTEHFSEYVQLILDKSVGKNLKEGHFPDKVFWIIDKDGYAGRILLGLASPADCGRLGHHVGYDVRPSKRRKGYATQALQCIRSEAAKLGILALEVRCGPENIASRKVIERNGGMLLENLSRDGELRFIIKLEDGSVHETHPS